MLLKGRAKRAQVCLVVAINIKEPLVVVEGRRGGEDMGLGTWDLGHGTWDRGGFLSFCTDFSTLGVARPPSPHTLVLLIHPPAGSCPCCFPLRTPASIKDVFVCLPVAPNWARLSSMSNDMLPWRTPFSPFPCVCTFVFHAQQDRHLHLKLNLIKVCWC